MPELMRFGGSGNPVSRWNDSGQFGRHLVPASLQPSLRWNPFDGELELFFAATDRQLFYTAEGDIANAGLAMVFAVVRSGWHEDGGLDGQLVFCSAVNGSQVNMYGAGTEWRMEADTPFGATIANPGTRTGSGIKPQYQLLAGIYDGASSIFRVNGTQVTGTTNAAAFLKGGLQVGGRAGVIGFAGAIRELIFCFGQHYTLAQLKPFERMLADRHQLGTRFVGT